MRSITEDMEAANEELQSANEELQSSNEEMQSLNEELETSKEELQSTNEELIIVNQELLDKQEQLNVSHAMQLEAHKRVEESEKEQKKLASQLKLATDSAKVGIWSLDVKTEKLEWNGLLKKMWGYSEHLDNLTFEDWAKLVLPEDKELVFKRIEESKNNHSIYDAEYRIKRANDGTIAWMKSTGKHQYDDFGEAITLTGINLDITQQKEAEEKIRQSEKIFKSIFDNSLAAIVVTNDQGNYLSANKAANKLLGYEDNELMQMNVSDLKTTVKHDAAQRFEEYFSKSEDAGEFDFISKNGAHKFVQYQAIRINDDFNLSIMMDISEQKKSEEAIEKLATHLKLATDSAKVGIWSLDVISSKLEWSNIHKILWGYDEHREDLTYEDWHKLIVPEDKELAFQKVEESKVNHPIYEAEYRIIRANDGAVVWIKSTGQYQYDEFGFAHTLTGISIDISEQKQIDEELLEARNKAEVDKEIAENAVMAKQQFLSNMSHEIRTPMNAIIGFAKVLMKTDLTEKQKEYLQAINSSGNTLIVLINDILDLAKVDAGKMIFANTPFKIFESITSILHLFETKFEESNLELVKKYDSRIPKILLGDSVRLHQILINLLSNAIKFTAKGKISIVVNLLDEDEEKVALEIEVADTGIGIPQNKIATIFENFEQATNVTSSLYGGTGLGLAIVKQLVEKQGGTISVKSKVGEGSNFNFTLSFQKSIAEVALENEEVQYESEIKTLKVLIVEDVKLNQLLLRTILEDFKFSWDIADNGKIAIEKLETNSYDIILMDLQMPVMNGFEATEYIRKKMNLQIPIIALSADVTTVDVEKCKAVGMNDYISKPLDEKLLYNKIIDLIGSK